MRVHDVGIMEYAEAYALQERLSEAVFRELEPETLLLLEHYPVYTIGRCGAEENILDRSVRAVRINRGGDVTYHGPGQLVGYPLVNLRRRGCDLRLYLRFLEELLIRVTAGLGGHAYRVPGKTGVWSETGKLAAIGVGVRRWITMHGFSLNVNNDLTAFERINPCGIATCPIASLEMVCGREIGVETVKARIAEQFETLFDEWLPEAGTVDGAPALAARSG